MGVRVRTSECARLNSDSGGDGNDCIQQAEVLSLPQTRPLLQVEELSEILTAEMCFPHILGLFSGFLAFELSSCSLTQNFQVFGCGLQIHFKCAAGRGCLTRAVARGMSTGFCSGHFPTLIPENLKERCFPSQSSVKECSHKLDMTKNPQHQHKGFPAST